MVFYRNYFGDIQGNFLHGTGLALTIQASYLSLLEKRRSRVFPHHHKLKFFSKDEFRKSFNVHENVKKTQPPEKNRLSNSLEIPKAVESTPKESANPLGQETPHANLEHHEQQVAVTSQANECAKEYTTQSAKIPLEIQNFSQKEKDTLKETVQKNIPPKESTVEPQSLSRLENFNLERLAILKTNKKKYEPPPLPYSLEQPATDSKETTEPEKPPKRDPMERLALQGLIDRIKALFHKEIAEVLNDHASDFKISILKSTDSSLDNYLKSLKLAVQNYIIQELASEDPCQAEHRIANRLKKTQAMQASLEQTTLNTDDVNEALVWLRDLVEVLKNAEAEAAAKCVQWKKRSIQKFNQ